jgi:hypothetical protein
VWSKWPSTTKGHPIHKGVWRSPPDKWMSGGKPVGNKDASRDYSAAVQGNSEIPLVTGTEHQNKMSIHQGSCRRSQRPSEGTGTESSAGPTAVYRTEHADDENNVSSSGGQIHDEGSVSSDSLRRRESILRPDRSILVEPVETDEVADSGTSDPCPMDALPTPTTTSGDTDMIPVAPKWGSTDHSHVAERRSPNNPFAWGMPPSVRATLGSETRLVRPELGLPSHTHTPVTNQDMPVLDISGGYILTMPLYVVAQTIYTASSTNASVRSIVEQACRTPHTVMYPVPVLGVSLRCRMQLPERTLYEKPAWGMIRT